MKITFLELIASEYCKIFEPILKIAEAGDNDITVFIGDLGWEIPENQKIKLELGDLFTQMRKLISISDEISNALNDEDLHDKLDGLILEIPKTIKVILESCDDIKDKINSLDPDYSVSKETFFRRVVDYLFYVYLESYVKKLFSILRLTEIVCLEKTENDTNIKKIQWTRFIDWIMNPLRTFDTVYQWESGLDSTNLLKNLYRVFGSYLIPADFYKQKESIANSFKQRADDAIELRIPFIQYLAMPDKYIELDLNLSQIPAIPDKNKQSGILLYPTSTLGVDITKDISDKWCFTLKGNVDMNVGISLQVRPPFNIHVSPVGVEPKDDEEQNSHIELGFNRRQLGNDLTYIFGSQSGSYLAFGETGFNILLALENGRNELAAEMSVKNLSIKIDMSEGDGFLQKILSGVRVESVTDLTIGISNLNGFYFKGSGALEIEIPLHKSLGGIIFNTLYLKFITGGDMELQFAVSIGFKLGPITGNVNRIGFGIPFSIKDQLNGNLGPVDIQKLSFIPPTGAGISINAGGITGGGYLDIDNVNKSYAGILSLKFGEIALVAVGLINTRMPDGAKGFSLLINIGVTFSPAIQLSYGFTLNAVGGIIGFNRIMDIQVLQTGIKNHTFDSILFPDPETVIQNADRIISDLRSIFPPARDRYVVGPMIKIGWGSPSIITGSVGIFLEFPEPLRVVLLGQITAALPKEEEAVIVIHLDILGVLDLGKGELTFQASLYDSRILTFSIYGDAAMLIGFKNDPRFALSLGGFNPRFSPPPPAIIFAELRRLSIEISTGENLKLTCGAYQAITPNTLQFGARIDLYAKFGGASVTGYLYFDVLFYFSPFSFIADMGAGVTVKYKGHTLAEVDLAFTLSGPNPWNARGKAEFEILRISISKKFNITWGDEEKRSLAAVDPWNEFQNDAILPGNWNCVLPGNECADASLKSLKDDDDTIVIHPAGLVEFRQKRIPLKIRLDTVSNAPVSGHDTFVIDNASIINDSNNEEILPIEEIKEQFGRAQFIETPDKLSLPSFEEMVAGARFSDDGIRIAGEIEEMEFSFETILIDSESVTWPQKKKGRLGRLELGRIKKAMIYDRMRSDRSRGNRFANPYRQTMVSKPEEETYFLAEQDNLSPVDTIPVNGYRNTGLPRYAAEEYLRQQSRMSPGLTRKTILISQSELIPD